MDAEIRGLCTQDIGGNHQRLYSVHTQHVGITFKHVLLPLWLAAYRYQDQTYRILVNGATAKSWAGGPTAGSRSCSSSCSSWGSSPPSR